MREGYGDGDGGEKAAAMDMEERERAVRSGANEDWKHGERRGRERERG